MLLLLSSINQKSCEGSVTVQTRHYVCVQVEEEGEVELDDEDERGVVLSGCVVFLLDVLTA